MSSLLRRGLLICLILCICRIDLGNKSVYLIGKCVCLCSRLSGRRVCRVNCFGVLCPRNDRAVEAGLERELCLLIIALKIRCIKSHEQVPCLDGLPCNGPAFFNGSCDRRVVGFRIFTLDRTGGIVYFLYCTSLSFYHIKRSSQRVFRLSSGENRKDPRQEDDSGQNWEDNPCRKPFLICYYCAGAASGSLRFH